MKQKDSECEKRQENFIKTGGGEYETERVRE